LWLKLNNFFKFVDGQLQNLGGRRALLIFSQRAQVYVAQQLVGVQVIGVVADLRFRRLNRFLDATRAVVQLRKPVVQELRVGVVIERHLVLFDGPCGVLRAAVGVGHLFVFM